jgi:hypothetical protein
MPVAPKSVQAKAELLMLKDKTSDKMIFFMVSTLPFSYLLL